MPNDKDSKSALTIEDVRRMRAKYGSPTGRYNAESKPPSQNIPIPEDLRSDHPSIRTPLSREDFDRHRDEFRRLDGKAAKTEFATALDKLSASVNKLPLAYDPRVDPPIDEIRVPDYLGMMTNPNPWSLEETEGLMDSMRELAKDVKFEKPIPVDAKAPARWDGLLDRPPRACDYVSLFNVGKSRAPVDLSLLVSKARPVVATAFGYGTGKTLTQFERSIRGIEPDLAWDMLRDTVVERKVDRTFREPDLPRINAASVVADVQGELFPLHHGEGFYTTCVQTPMSPDDPREIARKAKRRELGMDS